MTVHFQSFDLSNVKSFLEILFCRSLLALVFPVLNSLFYQGITNCVLSWKRTLKLISNPFNELRIRFDGLLFKLPGKLRNWQSGSHPCFTLYINNWPKPQLRNGSPHKAWRSDHTFFQGLHDVVSIGKILPEGTVFLTCSIQLLYMATIDSSDQSIGLPNQILLKPWNNFAYWNMHGDQGKPWNFGNFDFEKYLKSTQWSRQHRVLHMSD